MSRLKRESPNQYLKTGSIFISILLLLASACSKQERKSTPAFYHWQTELALTDLESSYIDSLKVEKLYVKFFDVDQSGTAGKTKPLALLQAEGFDRKDLEIIPTIFITNRTLRNLNEEDIVLLSERMYKKINELRSVFDESPLTEIQIDCDWTLQTRKAYFKLLELLRKQVNNDDTVISATIRLHQIKFFEKTGVPPVDRGMLMFYNMGELTELQTINSIIDLNIADQYLNKLSDYPLALDIALPIFSWGVVFRDSKMLKLVNNLEHEALSDTSRFTKAGQNQYKVIKSTYLQGYYLYEGDHIRLEDSPIETVQAAAKRLAKLYPGQDLTVSLYHLDTATVKNYTYDQLQAVYDQF